jgi:cell shape-determining protein MreC
MLAGLILLIAPQSITNKFQFAFTRIFRWPIKVGNNISLATSQQEPFIGQSNRSEDQYRNKIDFLQQELKQAYQKIEELSGVRNRFPLTKGNLALTDIIKKTINNSEGKLIVNRGQADGLKVGQFVMEDFCIIGKISYVDADAARVKLFTDKTSSFAITIGDSNVPRLLKGIGNNQAKIIPQIPVNKNKISIGDKVRVQKTPGLLNVPMIAGIVTKCERDDREPSVWDITVRPACDITKIDEVTVIIMNP